MILESLKSKHAEAFPVFEADQTAAFTALYDEGKAQYRRVTENYEGSSPEDHCWFARTIFQGVERLKNLLAASSLASCSGRRSRNSYVILKGRTEHVLQRQLSQA